MILSATSDDDLAARAHHSRIAGWARPRLVLPGSSGKQIKLFRRGDDSTKNIYFAAARTML